MPILQIKSVVFNNRLLMILLCCVSFLSSESLDAIETFVQEIQPYLLHCPTQQKARYSQRETKFPLCNSSLTLPCSRRSYRIYNRQLTWRWLWGMQNPGEESITGILRWIDHILPQKSHKKLSTNSKNAHDHICSCWTLKLHHYCSIEESLYRHLIPLNGQE